MQIVMQIGAGHGVRIGNEPCTSFQTIKGNPMFQLTSRRLLLAFGFMCVAAVQTHAQGVHATQLLSNGSSCLHVIRSIQMYGVNLSLIHI